MNKIKEISILLMLVLIVSLSLVLGHTGTSVGPVSPVVVVYNGTIANNVTIAFDDDNTNISGPTAAQFNLTKLINVTLYDNLNGTWSVIRTNDTSLTNPVHLGWGRTIVNFNISHERLVSWNVEFTNSSNAKLWLFASNQTYQVDFVQIREIISLDTNNSAVNFEKPTLNMSFNSTDTPLRCCLWLSNNSDRNTFAEKECKNNAVNDTHLSFGGSSSVWGLSSSLTSYRYFFECNKAGTNVFNRSTNSNTLRYNPSAPVVVVTNYSNGYWSNTKRLNFTFVVNSDNPATCELWGNFDTVTWALNQSFVSVKNGTTVPFREIELADNQTGYTWGYRCNDTSNQLSVSNFTIYVDTAFPDVVGCISPENNTRGTDHKPNLTWNGTIDKGFANYTVYLFNASKDLPVFKYAVTSNNSLTFEITNNLTSDSQWYWNVSVVDQANNRNVSGNCRVAFNYYPDSVGYQLKSGYNFYSLVTEEESASQLCAEPSTIPTSVSMWNLTDNSWVSFVCGTATNNFTLTRNNPLVFNMPSDAVWERGRIWAVNTTVNYLNVSNQTGGMVALVGVFNDTTLQGIENGNRQHHTVLYNHTNSNYTIPRMSYVNHSGYYMPFKNNWTYNGAVQVFDGDTIWVELNATVQPTMFLNRSLWQ